MNIYSFYEDSSIRRRYLDGISSRFERKQCSICCPGSDYPKLISTHNRDVKLYQGSFVSNILWDWGHFHVTDELKNALQKEGFEGIEFEPTNIVVDKRPNKDKKKLPLDQIPQFYHAKLITSIPLHQDYIEWYNKSHNVKHCPKCNREIAEVHLKYLNEPLILDRNRHPGTDLMRVETKGYKNVCSERVKAFLETYPKTYLDFDRYELRY